MTRNWTSYDDRLNRVTKYIYENLDQDLNFEKLAEVASLSPYHWHRIYHASRGETAIATAKRLRLQRAAVSLAQSNASIEHIASRAGYGSVQAFTRAFSEAYGLPPGKYRESGSHTEFKPGQLGAPRASWSIEIKQLPALPALGVRHTGPYMEIGKAFESLFGQAASRNALPSTIRMIAIYLDDPATIPPARLRSIATIPTADTKPCPPLERIEICGGDYAILRHKGPYADMWAAYIWLFGTWLPQSGREAADLPVLEEYLNNPRDTPPSDLLTDLCLPLR
jgi:AraC family transcriptional regulator